MPPYRLIPNSPRKRIEYVFKSLGQKVARDTACVVAHTVGVDAFDFNSITRLRVSGGAYAEKINEAMIESFPGGPSHPAEALIPWVGQRLAAYQKEVRKGRLDEREYDQLVEELERMLPQIATWVHHTRPDLTSLSIADAMSQAAVFEDPGAPSDVPQGEVIYRFADGWTIQNLTTPEQIFADGDHVQNCLKRDRFGPGYVDRVRYGKTKIFSLRKPSGIPVISIEYDVPDKSFAQIYAKQNTPLGINLDALLNQDKWRDRPDDARIFWKNIQQYKPRMTEFLTAFGADPGAFVMADALLPAGLTSVGGNLDLCDYDRPLPAGLTSVSGDLDLTDYDHPLPAGLTSVGGYLNLSGHKHPLPAGLTSVGGGLNLFRYNHPLPPGLTSVGNYLDLTNYKHPLPAGLTSVGGDLTLTNYNHPLPAGLTSVGGNLDLYGYAHPLPAGLTSVGGYLDLRDYKHPLPAGLTSVRRSLDLTNYKHPLPAGLVVGGQVFSAEHYPYSLAQLGIESASGRLRNNPRRRKTSRKTSRRARRTSRK